MPNNKISQTKGYTYKDRASFSPVDPTKMKAHADRVQRDVIPTLKTQAERKEAGAQRLRFKGLL